MLEGVIWLQANAADGAPVPTPAVELWLLIAWTLLPVTIPLAVRAFEPDHRRQQAMSALARVASAPGIPGHLVDGVGHHRRRRATPPCVLRPFAGWLLVIPYGAATCLPMVLSSQGFVRFVGVAIAASMAVTILVDARAFSSIWCFFAAASAWRSMCTTPGSGHSGAKPWPTSPPGGIGP